ncbi:uncharacterized protein P884DRAFT_270721 [Thermothelomyces heterothallicus CBS 202.75]|uniref:uncharacterized protein n=1 Tax=Thermothelomyces heterothallicus CBS 202.75 TaxID=1149848 RepID=UPI0037422D9B
MASYNYYDSGTPLAASAFRKRRASPTTTEPRPCIQLDIRLQLRVDRNIDAVDWAGGPDGADFSQPDGAPDKPDAYDVVQTNVQTEVLRPLTELARSGDLDRTANSSHCRDQDPKQ